MATLEAVVPSLGAILVNLGLKEALDFEARFRDEVVESLPLGVSPSIHAGSCSGGTGPRRTSSG